MFSKRCRYCHRKMEVRDGYWYCEHCNSGEDFPEEDDDDNDEPGPWEEYRSTRPWGYDNDGY